METITQKEAINIFSSPKKTIKLLEKTLKSEDVEFYIASKQKGIYSIFDKGELEICSQNSVYNCLVGLLYFRYGVGKVNIPTWAMSNYERQYDFEKILSKVDSSNNMFSSLQKNIDEGGVFYYSSSKNVSSFKMPENFNFRNGLVINCASFSDGITEIDSMLSVLTCDSNLEQ